MKTSNLILCSIRQECLFRMARIAALAILSTLVFILSAHAGPVTVKANWDIKAGPILKDPQGNDRVGDDFHMVIDSDVRMTLTESFGPRFSTKPTPGAANSGVFSMILDWSGTSRFITPNDTFHVGVTVTEDSFNEIKVSDVTLIITDITGHSIGRAIATGFKAERQSPLSFTLFNDAAEPVEISSLAFKYTMDEVSLSDLFPFTLPGFTPISGSFSIASGGSLSFPVGDPPVGGFLLVEGTTVGQMSGLTSSFVFEHQDVPEPSTLLLLGSGLVGLIGFGRKRLMKRT